MTTHPALLLIWASVVSTFFVAALTAAFWLRFDAPIWSAF